MKKNPMTFSRCRTLLSMYSVRLTQPNSAKKVRHIRNQIRHYVNLIKKLEEANV